MPFYKLYSSGALVPNNKIQDLSKFKAFADNKLNVTQKLEFVFNRAEDIVEKGENAGYLHFLHFSAMFGPCICGKTVSFTSKHQCNILLEPVCFPT